MESDFRTLTIGGDKFFVRHVVLFQIEDKPLAASVQVTVVVSTGQAYAYRMSYADAKRLQDGLTWVPKERE